MDESRRADSHCRRIATSARTFVAWFSVVLALPAIAATPGVLVIHSNQRPTPAAITIEDTLRTAIPAGLKGPVEIYSEYLDSEWTSVQAYGAAEAEFLREKYAPRNIGIIMAAAPAALQFTTAYRDRLFPGVPIVHIAMPRDTLEQMKVPADVVGKTVDLDPLPTLKLALRLHPDANHIVFVVGAAERDRVWEQRLREAAAKLGDGVAADYLIGLPTSELTRRLVALPPRTVVFSPGYFSDGTGQVITPRRSMELIAQASRAPVYGALDTFMGTGIVGGYVTPYDAQAREAATIAARLLTGTPPTEIAPSSVPQVPTVDWRQLRRWRVYEGLLPEGTIIKFREPTVVERYGAEIAIALAILLFQAGLIAALLWERRTRRQTASALAESQQQINLAARAVRLSLWIWDVSRNQVRVAQSRPNPGDMKEQIMTFDDVVAAVHPADRETLRRAIRRARATGEEVDVEYRVVAKDGDVRWLAARGRAEQGDSERLLGVALDITERKAAELREAEGQRTLRHMTRIATVGQLSAAISHQLNQPLASILGNAETALKMLGREPLDMKELRDICRDIVNEDHRATNVIRRLGELYKRGDMRMEAIDLNHLIRETLELLDAELLIRHVVVATNLEPALPPIAGGQVQLQQVILNLVLNAADAMSALDPEARRLTIRTEGSGAEVRLYVEDNGPGIPPDHLKAVFDPFWTTKTGGMGMGLAICQSIVAAHRGTITAVNAVCGAIFCVTLPAKRTT